MIQSLLPLPLLESRIQDPVNTRLAATGASPSAGKTDNAVEHLADDAELNSETAVAGPVPLGHQQPPPVIKDPLVSITSCSIFATMSKTLAVEIKIL